MNSSTTTNGNAHNQYQWRRPTLFLLLLSLAFTCSIISYSRLGKLTLVSSSSLADDDSFDFDAPSSLFAEAKHDNRRVDYYPMDEAEFIIQKSYAETYARMYPCEDGVMERQCIELVMQHLHAKHPNNNSNGTDDNQTPQQFNHHHFSIPSSHPYPWWFLSLLRDLPTNGAYGWWHHFTTNSTTPPIKFCAIGKNGSTEWRNIFKMLNYDEYCGVGGMKRKKLDEEGDRNTRCEGNLKTKVVLSDDPKIMPQTVFIRDPLERLLSGYLDKCVKPIIRRMQGHCEPNVIFAADNIQFEVNKARRQGTDLPKDKDQGPFEDLVKEIRDADKEMFATYVDLMPLKWNVHFVPQALFCDLYRTVDEYDFVGVMGKKFMSELDRMGRRYGGPLPDALDTAFDYKSKVLLLDNNSNANKVVQENVGADNKHGTKAPEKVARYYSARSVRRALEYLSIDYVTLGLEVPEWAKEMLRNDDRFE